MSLKRIATLSLAIVATAAGQIWAATITEWNLAAAPGNQATTAASNNAAGVAGSDLSRGSGLTANAGANSMNSVGWDTAPAATPGADTDHYDFGFDVTGVNKRVQTESLYVGMRSSGTGPGTIGLYANVDGGGFGLVPIQTFTSPGDGTFLNAIADLSSLPDISDSLRLRLIEVGNTDASPPGTTGSAGTYRVTAYFVSGAFDRNMQITGAVVPEPASIVLLGLTLIGMFGIYRRK